MSSVTIKTLQQKTFTIDIDHTETVRALKEKIQEKEKDFLADSLKLIYAGKILDDGQPLTKYNIKPDRFIVVMVTKSKAPPKPVATEEASATTTTTSEESSTSTQETSTPATSQPVQTDSTVAVESSDGAERMETSEATPTAQASNTAESRGREALQQAGSALATGQAFDEAVSNLMAMGYEQDLVVRALNASFNNPDRAAEMLFDGTVPETAPLPRDEAEQVPGEQPTRDTPSQQAPAPREHQGNPFELLRGNPQFQALRQMVASNPQALPVVLQQIARSNPQLYQLISHRQQEFIDLLNEPIEASSGSGASAPPQAPLGAMPPSTGAPPSAPFGGPPPGPVSIQVTPEEKEAIDRLKDLGFSEGMAIQAYFACDKNEELAANFLFSNKEDDQ